MNGQTSFLTTFNSLFRWYGILRMPFGLEMLQDVFQAKIDQAFKGCKGTIGIADNIVVYSTTEEEVHDQHLHDMMARCKGTGLKLNPEEDQILWHTYKLWQRRSVQPDPDKVSTLHKYGTPIYHTRSPNLFRFSNLHGSIHSQLRQFTDSSTSRNCEERQHIWVDTITSNSLWDNQEQNQWENHSH